MLRDRADRCSERDVVDYYHTWNSRPPEVARPQRGIRWSWLTHCRKWLMLLSSRESIRMAKRRCLCQVTPPIWATAGQRLGNGWARVVDASPGDGLPLGVGELRSALRAVGAIRGRLPLLQHQPRAGSLGADCSDVSEIRQAASVRRQASCHRGVVPVISWEPGNATRRQSSERIDRTLVHSGKP